MRTYAELVRMTAEMRVGQRNQQAEQQWRRQRCDDLLALLLSEAGDSPRLLDEAQQLGLKPQLTRVPYLFELGMEHGPGQTVEALSAWLMSRYPDSWCEHDGQSQACADALGIHRNSLRLPHGADRRAQRRRSA